MFKAYLEVFPLLNNEEFKLKPIEMDNLQDAYNILCLVEKLTHKLSADHRVKISEMIQLISWFQSILKKLKLKTEYGEKLKLFVSKQLKNILKKEERLLCAQATLLDPRFKALYFTDEFSSLFEEAKKCIITKATKDTETPENNSNDSNNVDNEKDSPNSILEEHKERIRKKAKISHNNNVIVNVELCDYLVSDTETGS